ncbi:MAG: sodium:solute symporter [Candidatus Cryptobacteroides sp.]
MNGQPQTGFSFGLLVILLISYFALVFVISGISSKKADSHAFFGAGRRAPWPVVAFGMLGASLTGLSFISVPGNVLRQNCYYFPMVLGFVAGYILIAKVLLPLYYKRGLCSIYGYLEERFGAASKRSGAAFFILSRLLGSAVRLYAILLVLQTFLPFRPSPCLFLLLAAAFLLLLFCYTCRGGVKTIVWTDAFQTLLMLLTLGLSIHFICKGINWADSALPATLSGYAGLFDLRPAAPTHALKQFVSGFFVTVAMTGLDQSMMQKNLACKDLASSQKNMYLTAAIILIVNLLLLALGVLLGVFVQQNGGMDAMGLQSTDQLLPFLAASRFPAAAGAVFVLGLVAASCPSAAAALTSITSSVCLDFLQKSEQGLRKKVQAIVTFAFMLVLAALYFLNNDALINIIYTLASYTYGPLLGLFFFGILTRRSVPDRKVLWIMPASPLLCLALNGFLRYFCKFDLGFSLLMVNALLCFGLLWLFSRAPKAKEQ